VRFSRESTPSIRGDQQDTNKICGDHRAWQAFYRPSLTSFAQNLGLISPSPGGCCSFLQFRSTFGFFMALIPPLLVALLDYGWRKALLVLVGLWVINFIFDNIIKPKFMKEGLDIPSFRYPGAHLWSWVLGPSVRSLLSLDMMARNLVLHTLLGPLKWGCDAGGDGHGSGG